MTSTLTRIKCALALIVIAILSIGPIPITSTFGAFVALFRPRWFKTLVDTIYRNNHTESNNESFSTPSDTSKRNGLNSTIDNSSTTARLQLFLSMLILMILDIGPIPTASLIALFIVAFRPRWFTEMIKRIYRGKN